MEDIEPKDLKRSTSKNHRDLNILNSLIEPLMFHQSAP